MGNRSDFSSADEDLFPEDGEGLPQGGILSPLFANVYLHRLDQEMIANGFKMVRYADDFIVMCDSKEKAKEAHDLAMSIVQDELGLRLYGLNEIGKSGKIKSEIKPFQDVTFLGLLFQGGKVYPSREKEEAVRKWIAEIPQKFSIKPLALSLKDIKSAIYSWSATYYFTDLTEKFLSDLDTDLAGAMKVFFRKYRLKLVKGSDDPRQLLSRFGVPCFSEAFIKFKD